MRQIISQSGKTSYGIQQFIIDKDEDVKMLPIDIPMGSMALSIESGNVFVLNGTDDWVNVTNKGGNSQSGSSTKPEEYPLASDRAW